MNAFTDSYNSDIKPLGLITGIRLQPLVDLRSEKTIAWEVLSQATDPDSLFSSLTKEYSLAIFLWQANEVLQSEGQYWLNLPVQTLLDPLCLSLLFKQEHQNRLTIEIQDPQTLLTLNTLELMQFKSGLSMLRHLGWRIWLDDVTSALVSDLALLSLQVDGVKIDRLEFRDPPAMLQLVETARSLSHNVLVEGIESQEMLETVSPTTARLGQGFYWPETARTLPVPDSICERAHAWHVENQLTAYRQIKVLISCAEPYFQQGLEYLLWSLAREQFRTRLTMPIRLTGNEAEADIILRDADAGERPFECSLFGTEQSAITQQRFKQFIVIHGDNADKRFYRCPIIGGSVSAEDNAAHALELLKQALSRALSKHQHDTVLVKNSTCAQCKKNALTQRERDIVRQMANGVTPRHLAIQYGCKVKTVSAHKRSAMRKLNIKNNIVLYRYLKQMAETSLE